MIPVSVVVSEEATALTQGAGARRLGRRLLLAAGRGDDSWARQHLRTGFTIQTRAPRIG